MELRQYLYFGLAAKTFSDEDLRELLKVAREANSEHGITGMLIYVGNYFIQHIEGAPAPIGQLVENIRADDRIQDFTCLIDEAAPERVFPDWSMGFETRTIPSLLEEPAFLHLSSPTDLDLFRLDEHAAWRIMKNFYHDNRNAPTF